MLSWGDDFCLGWGNFVGVWYVVWGDCYWWCYWNIGVGWYGVMDVGVGGGFGLCVVGLNNKMNVLSKF